MSYVLTCIMTSTTRLSSPKRTYHAIKLLFFYQNEIELSYIEVDILHDEVKYWIGSLSNFKIKK